MSDPLVCPSQHDTWCTMLWKANQFTSLLVSITRHPQCRIAECQKILPVHCCSISCNHHRNMHRSAQVQQAGKDIFKHSGSLYPSSRGGWGHGLQLELVLVRTLWAQCPHHRQTNHDQLVSPPPDWQCGFGTTVWFDTWHAKTCCLKEFSPGGNVPAVLSVVVASTNRSLSSVLISLLVFSAYNSRMNFLAAATLPSKSSSGKLLNFLRLSACFTSLE